MSRYYRGSLPDGEEERLNALTLKVLNFLEIGPTTNAFFAAHGCLDYRKRVNELRRDHGYHIKASRKKGQKGLFEYRLLDEPEPEWEVIVKTIVPDGQFLVYSIVVNAATATEARNNAPRKYVLNKIMSVRRVSAENKDIATREQSGHLYRENQRLRLALAKTYKRLKECRARKGS